MILSNPLTVQRLERRQIQYVKVEDLTPTAFYLGRAAHGSSTGAAVWQIKKVVEEVGDDIVHYFADDVTGYTKTWDDRATYSFE